MKHLIYSWRNTTGLKVWWTLGRHDRMTKDWIALHQRIMLHISNHPRERPEANGQEECANIGHMLEIWETSFRHHKQGRHESRLLKTNSRHTTINYSWWQAESTSPSRRWHQQFTIHQKKGATILAAGWQLVKKIH